MVLNIPAEAKDHFTPLGESSVRMPLIMMEKYVYPTIKLMQYLPGGIETMALL
jgi:hypothetical protein